MQEKPRDIKERTFAFSVRVVQLCRELEKQPGTSRTLSNQLLRSGTSIGANVEEAHGGQSRADFIAKLSIACKEARATNYWLRLLSASDTLPASHLESITDEASQLIAILTSIIRNTKKNLEL